MRAIWQDSGDLEAVADERRSDVCRHAEPASGAPSHGTVLEAISLSVRIRGRGRPPAFARNFLAPCQTLCHHLGMPNPSSIPENKVETYEAARAAAALFGRMGGLKGGPARAARLTAEERSSIASTAAKARWATKREQKP